ncbi:DUF2520 domain-containing protein [Cytophagaceae bacterium ABcell3]|nr:DUF2520 domain-containing protein [Cytophagaceae bacterium ABcell3]
MPASYKISFVGAGNVAWNLAPAFENAGIKVEEIYSRNKDHAQNLTHRLYDAIALDCPDFSSSKSDVIVIAVPDDYISEVVAQLQVPDHSIVVHTSGTAPLEVLDGIKQFGVMYPLQTFSKSKAVQLDNVPFFLEGSDEQVYELIEILVSAVSKHIYRASSADRLSLHVAAVFACNFTNHLYGISDNILKQANLPFDVLKPLIAETMEKAFLLSPAEAQTGPAVRKDVKTLEKHLSYLSGQPALKDLYKILTKRLLRKE